MDYIPAAIILLVVVGLIIFALRTIRKCDIYEYQRGLFYNRGKFVAVWAPGSHWYFKPYHSYNMVDVRILDETIPGQEVLSLDNVGIRISLAVKYQVVDPYLAINKVVNYQDSLYLAMQVTLRDIIGSFNIEDLLGKREEIGKLLFEKSVDSAAEIGLKLYSARVKDIMLPGELRTIFSQEVNARHEGLAKLERARGESAALRNLANTAHVLENNPSLMQLRLLQTLEKSSGNTLVLVPPEAAALSRVVEKKSGKGEKK